MFSEGEPSGEGIMFFANGDQYIGEWRAGHMDGKGVIKYTRGDTYEGTFMKGFYYGEGKYTYTDGGYYSGEYKYRRVNPITKASFPEPTGLRHGFGMRVWANGTTYQGEFAHDYMVRTLEYVYLYHVMYIYIYIYVCHVCHVCLFVYLFF